MHGTVNIKLAFLLFVVRLHFVNGPEWFIGVMEGTFLIPPFYYICFDPFIWIIRLNYLRDNSVISLESSYCRGGLRPPCWIKMNFRCRN